MKCWRLLMPRRITTALSANRFFRLQGSSLVLTLILVSAALYALQTVRLGVPLQGLTKAANLDQPPVLHFLFMAGEKLLFMDQWADFFSGAPPGSYSVWLHCTDQSACERFLDDSPSIPGLHLVESVPSLYYFDLVSPMSKLLQEALQCTSGYQPEKFVLLSPSHLPLKPFTIVQQRLAAHSGSVLCTFDEDMWSWYSHEGKELHNPKTSQWAILSRPHAAAFVKNFIPSHFMMLQWSEDEYLLLDKNCMHGALDENVVVSLITRLYGREDPFVKLLPENACPHLVAFDKWYRLPRDLNKLPGSHWSWPDPGRPVTIEALSERALSMLKHVPFYEPMLFARKFSDNAVLGNFSGILLGAKDPGLPLEVKVQRLPPVHQCPGFAGTPQEFMVHLLFLFQQELPKPHLLLWRLFFKDALPGQWSAWAHCTSASCGQQKAPWKWVHIPEGTCADTLCLYLKLVRMAMRGDGLGPDEKFVFLADTFLPVKSFASVYSILLARPRPPSHIAVSDFCLYEEAAWMPLPQPHGSKFFVKHSRWIVLSRNDARALLNVAASQRSMLYASKSWDDTTGIHLHRIPFPSSSVSEVAPYAFLFGFFPQPNFTEHWIPQPRPLWADLSAENDFSSHQLFLASRCRVLDLAEQSQVTVRFRRKLKLTRDVKFVEKGRGFVQVGAKAAEVLSRSDALFAGPFPPFADLSNITQVLSKKLKL